MDLDGSCSVVLCGLTPIFSLFLWSPSLQRKVSKLIRTGLEKIMGKRNKTPMTSSQPPKKRRGRNKYSRGFNARSSDRASNVNEAVHQVVENKMSIRNAARQYNLSYGFLYRRVSGEVDVDSRNGPVPFFNAEEERALARWLSEMAKRGMGLSPGDFLDFVEGLLIKEKRNFKTSRPSYTWYYAFMARNSDVLQRRKDSVLESSRVRVTQDKVVEWFDSYREFVSDLQLLDKPHRVWNADETGFQMGSKSGHVIGPTKSEYPSSLPHLSGGSSKQRLTVMFCGSAEGALMPPFFVFPKPCPTAYDPLVGSARGSAVHYTKKGWMDSDTFLKFLDHFDRHAGPERPVILLIDSASCHIDVTTFDYAVAHGIEIFRIVPNATHLMQPLDVGIFGALKRQWNTTVKRNTKENPGKPINKATFPRKLNETVTAFYKPLTIVNSFKSSGIHPINRQAISNDKLKPSLTFQSSTLTAEAATSAPVQGADQAFQVFQSVLDKDTLTKYEKRMSIVNEGNGGEMAGTVSPRFETYKQLKLKAVPAKTSSVPHAPAQESQVLCGLDMLAAAVEQIGSTPNNPSDSTQPTSSASMISSTLQDALTFPQAGPSCSSRPNTLVSSLPDNLTSSKCLRQMALHKLKKIRHKAEMEKNAKKRYLKKLSRSAKVNPTSTETFCTVCNISYEHNVHMGDNLLWIQCDGCLKWMHQTCVPSTLAYDPDALLEHSVTKFVCHECVV
ncbi:uncharacterized protein [Asterias amurensis]|uniref:uncharacterized protein n=1 Tax=Asterias amurensis TaxID=7602 RepID=UPI003AB7B675